MNKEQIIEKLQQIDSCLEPENLHCDGEVSPMQANSIKKRLLAERKRLQKLLDEY